MKKRKILISVALAAAAVFSLGSCADSSTSTTTAPVETTPTPTPTATTTPAGTTTPQGTSTPTQGTSTPTQGTTTPTPTTTPTSVTPTIEVKELKLHYNPLKYDDPTSEVDLQDVFVGEIELDQEAQDGSFYGEVALPTDIAMLDDYHNFTGWFKDKACTQAFTDAEAANVTDDVELYAGWESKGTKTINYEFKADSLTTGKYENKRQSIFKYTGAVRVKAASADGRSYTNSFQFADSTTELRFTPGADTTITLFFTDQSSNSDAYITIKQDGTELDEKGKATDPTHIGADGVNTADKTLRSVQVDVEGKKEVVITRGSGTIDLNAIEFTCVLPVAEMREINIDEAGIVDYIEGQAFDKSQIVASLVYKNDSTDPISNSDLDINLDNFDKTQQGTYKVGVSYDAEEYIYGIKYERTFTKEIDVNVYELDSINLYQDATTLSSGNYINNKTTVVYEQGDEFSTKYMTVKALGKLGTAEKEFTLAAKSSTVTDGYEIDNATSFDAATLGAKVITVSYTTNAKTETASYTVVVVDTTAADAVAVDETTKTITVTVDGAFNGVEGAKDATLGNQFKTINSAMQFLRLATAGKYQGYNIAFNIAAGYYNEKVEFDLPNMTVRGAGAQKFAANTETHTNDYDFTAVSNKTIIEWDSLYGMVDASGYVQVTDSTATVAVRKSAENFKIEDVTISNWYNSKVHFDEANYHIEHRALALIVYADQFVMENCALYGYQDTIELFEGRQVVSNTLITGTTDFIFGSNNTTYFANCEIRSIAAEDSSGKPNNQGGYVTAFKGVSGDNYVKYGAIFDGCDFTCDIEVLYGTKEVKASGDKSVEEVFDDLKSQGLYYVKENLMTAVTTETYDANTTYYVKATNTAFARAWGDKAKVAVINSTIGEHVSKQGFTSTDATSGGTTRGQRYVAWDSKTNFPNTAATYADNAINYYEYNNNGLGAIDTEVAGMHFLESTHKYNDMATIFATKDNGTMKYNKTWLGLTAKDSSLTVKDENGNILCVFEGYSTYKLTSTELEELETALALKATGNNAYSGVYLENTFSTAYDLENTALAAGDTVLFAKYEEAQQKTDNFALNLANITTEDGKDKSPITAMGTGNTFLTLQTAASSSALPRRTAVDADIYALENTNYGLSVTFKGTGTLTVSYASTGSSNSSTVGVSTKNDGTGFIAAADETGLTKSTEVTNAYVVTGSSTYKTITFNITAAGTYYIACPKTTAYGRGARINAITMSDTYLVQADKNEISKTKTVQFGSGNANGEAVKYEGNSGTITVDGVEFNVDATTGKLDNTNNATWAQFNQGATVSFKVKAGATVTVTTNGNAAISYTIGSAAAVNATAKTTTFAVAADSTIVITAIASDWLGTIAVEY